MKYLNIHLTLDLTHSNFFSRHRLKPTSRLVLMHLINFINSETLKLYPSLKKLSLSSGCDIKQITRALAELEETKIITKLRIVGKVNHYRFTDFFLQEIGSLEKITSTNLSIGKKTLSEMTFCQKVVSFFKKAVSKSQTNMHEHEFNNNKFSSKNFSGDNQKDFLKQQKKSEALNEKKRIERNKMHNDMKKYAVPPPPEFLELGKKFKKQV